MAACTRRPTTGSENVDCDGGDRMSSSCQPPVEGDEACNAWRLTQDAVHRRNRVPGGTNRAPARPAAAPPFRLDENRLRQPYVVRLEQRDRLPHLVAIIVGEEADDDISIDRDHAVPSRLSRSPFPCLPANASARGTERCRPRLPPSWGKRPYGAQQNPVFERFDLEFGTRRPVPRLPDRLRQNDLPLRRKASGFHVALRRVRQQ